MTPMKNDANDFPRLSPEYIKRAKEVFDAELRMRLDYIPVSVFVLLDDKKIIYKNEFCKRVYPRIKVGSRISNYGDIDFSGVSYSVVDFYGDTVSLIYYKIEVGGYAFGILCEMGDFLADDKVVAELMRQQKNLSMVITSAIDCMERYAEDSVSYKKYINHLSESVYRLKLCQRIMTNFTGVSKKHETFDVRVYNLASLIKFVKKCASSELSALDISFSDEVEVYAASPVNFEDFSRILIYSLNFFLLYSGGDKLSLFLEEGVDYNKITITCNDKLNLKNTFEKMFDSKGDDYVIDNDFILFSPLFSAVKLCKKYGYRIDLIGTGKEVALVIKVKSGKELPEFVLRSDNNDITLFLDSIFENEYISSECLAQLLSIFCINEGL